MNISVQKLLTKMEAELQQAKMAQKPESLREKVYSIKILSELILDEIQAGGAVMEPLRQRPQPKPSSQPKKLELDDEANGDSLFDF